MLFSSKLLHLVSTITKARKDTISLRTTIPNGIVAFLQLKESDKIEWVMENKGTKRITIVRRQV